MGAWCLTDVVHGHSVGGWRGNAARVEEKWIRGHALRHTAHLVRLEWPIFHFGFECKGRLDQRSGHRALQAPTLQHSRAGRDVDEPLETVEVRHKEHHWFAVCKVRLLIPPLSQPAGGFFGIAASKQATLKLLALACNSERYDSRDCLLVFTVVEQGAYGTQIAYARLSKVRHR